MADAIVSREVIRAKGRAAFLRGDSLDSHGMNPWAPALEDWRDAYAAAADELHHAVTEARGIELAQEVA
jgi:hypothetical protein